MAYRKVIDDDASEDGTTGRVSAAARLLIQGPHRFYTLALQSDVLAVTCVVDTRAQSPNEGFQRALDVRRAEEIANYIDAGFGTIPTSVILSAQPEAELIYTSRTQVLSFKKHPRAFLILDGQHRVYGFALAKSKVKVPVVIYNGLSRSDEARLFIDINTKQRPVPNELLLDISRMAQTESSTQALMRDIFDRFMERPDSALAGLMSPSARQSGQISRVTMNAALRPIFEVFGDNGADYIYSFLNAYLQAWKPTLEKYGADITSSTLLRAMLLLFPAVAERVTDRFGNDYTVERFSEVLSPFFTRVRGVDLKRPGSSVTALHEAFKKALQSGFAIGRANT
jgi:DGQHR domain-containing protein